MRFLYKILYLLRSKPLFRHFLYSVAIFIFLIFGISIILGIYTRHGKTVEIPDLLSLSLPKVKYELSKRELNFQILDSAKYHPNLPKYAIIEQIPKPGKKVKKGRIVYLTINPSGYRKVKIPKIIQVTYRNAVSMLRATGLDLGDLIYEDNIGKDMVLRIRYKKDTISPGSLVPVTSKIDLICGNGNTP